MRKKIRDSRDIEELLIAFYGRLLSIDEFHHIFMDLAKINFQEHLPRLTAFWESVYFNPEATLGMRCKFI